MWTIDNVRAAFVGKVLIEPPLLGADLPAKLDLSLLCLRIGKVTCLPMPGRSSQLFLCPTTDRYCGRLALHSSVSDPVHITSM